MKVESLFPELSAFMAHELLCDVIIAEVEHRAALCIPGSNHELVSASTVARETRFLLGKRRFSGHSRGWR